MRFINNIYYSKIWLSVLCFRFITGGNIYWPCVCEKTFYPCLKIFGQHTTIIIDRLPEISTTCAIIRLFLFWGSTIFANFWNHFTATILTTCILRLQKCFVSSALVSTACFLWIIGEYYKRMNIAEFNSIRIQK